MTELNQSEVISNEEANGAEAVPAAPKKSSKPKDYVPREALTVELFSEYLELKEDGYFYWKKATVRSIVGDFAGTVNPVTERYILVFKGTTYNSNDLKEFLKTGVMPPVTRGGGKAGTGAPKAPKSTEPRVPRVAPVYTEEQKAEAKRQYEQKRASVTAALAAKKAAEAARVTEGSVAEGLADDAQTESVE